MEERLDEQKFKQAQVALAELESADYDRAQAYAKDLLSGLKIIRTFPQGVTIFGSARLKESNKYYKSARELGALLAKNGHTVITGGGPGIMEAANRGAFEYGGRSIGLNITLAHEQSPNPYLTDVLQFEYFFARKVMLAMSAKVYVFFPGGFGTMDEFSEVLILMQEKKMPIMPIFLFGKTFWRPLDRFYATKMTALKTINPSDRKIYKLTDSVEEIVAAANKIGHPKVKSNYYDGFASAQHSIHSKI
ncbi:TIGR00730 family Rossman fold protein [Candidatus Saccharibacteria bacterium]|nr:TIGR00730 family Rossman fold protein [Candidatus Saccharibacteria bacterium]